MDDVTTYMKIPEVFNLSNKANSKEGYSIKFNKLFYWLKQSGRVWYNCIIEYLLKEGYINDPICPCIYMKIFNLINHIFLVQ